ncbi:MAG: oxidoreductase, partial [Bacteroidota bacterium]
LSWYGLKEVQVSLGGSFHIGRKQVISSQVSHIPANRSARWDRQRRKTAVFELLKNPVWDEHIGKVMPFEEAQKLFEQLRVGTFSELSCLLSYR